MAEVSSSTSKPAATNTTSTTANTTKTGVLGLGSSNKLSDDTLNKLKAADEAAQINPITTKISKNSDQAEDLTALTTILNKVDSTFSALTNEANYLKRAVSSTGTSATISVSSGVSIQDIDLNVTQLAQRDSFQSVKFKDSLSLIGATQDSSFNLEIGGKKYEMNVKSSTTYLDLVDMINERAGQDLQARLINVGEGYQLVLQSKETGAENSIKFTDATGDALSKLGWDDTAVAVTDENGAPVLNPDGSAKMTTNLEKSRLTKAQDAKFEYNGLQITRTKNTFDDLRSGITITLKETGKSSFGVTQDTKDLTKSVEDMIAAYNMLTENLNVATKYDDKTGQSGLFQGVSEITSIRSTLNRILTGQNAEGKSIDQYGISMNEKGKLEFDSKVFSDKLNSDAEDVKRFFMGSTKIETISYYGTNSVAAGNLKLDAGNLTINGISVKLEETQAGSSSKDNALALLKAINSANIMGLSASLSPDETRIILKSSDGGDIEIKGRNNILSNFGMSESTINTKTTTTSGLFTDMSKQLEKLISEKEGSEGSLTLFATRLKNENKKLEEEKGKAQESLDKKYNQMRETWSKYDTMIAKLENQFASLKAMIEAEMNRKD